MTDSDTNASHAIVIGGSIAGLTAARVLTDYFDKVIIVDRDFAPEPGDFRKGLPQARHAHRLMPYGQKILEDLFPGLVEELLADGAVAVDPSEDITFDYETKWETARPRPDWLSLSCSRALLDATIYKHLMNSDKVELIQSYDVTGLRTDAHNQRVTGVRLQCRRCQSYEIELQADLVVDASGRNSKAPQWLEALGYTPPEEWSINSFVGYATRIYERPAKAA
jgi:2-polyprenyl-6-methoxyphenol hydroxylase-like FAD-dependent oxidoreductase